jgi:hypothetical protein
MDKSYVLIAGTGATSRANLEALVEDYFYAKGKDTCLVLSFDKMPSQGQVFAAQYAKDKGKDIVVFCKDGANVSSIPSTASVSFMETPITDAVDMATTVMLLWDDSDQNCMGALEYCKSVGKVAYNLCEGLTVVKTAEPTDEVVITPVEPEKEYVPSPKMQVPIYPDQSLTEAQKAEIAKLVMVAVEAALQDALKKA